jgi:hypothetical protein
VKLCTNTVPDERAHIIACVLHMVPFRNGGPHFQSVHVRSSLTANAAAFQPERHCSADIESSSGLNLQHC